MSREIDPAPYQVGPDICVSLSYEVFDADGELVGGSRGPVEVVFGFGEILPGIERAIDGTLPGQTKTVRLKAKDAFGERDPKAVLEVDRSEFPDDVAPGDTFEAEGEGGEVVVLRVLDVLEDAVILDQNHPLAGQALRVEVRILATRPATAAELERAGAEATDPGEEPDSPLIAAERLLRGPSRR